MTLCHYDTWTVNNPPCDFTIIYGYVSTYLFGLTNFSRSDFHRVLGDWTNAIPNLLSSNLLQWKNPKISQLHTILPITQKSPNFQSNRQSLISEVQKLSNLEGTLPQDWLKLEHYFVITGFPHPPRWLIYQKKQPKANLP